MRRRIEKWHRDLIQRQRNLAPSEIARNSASFDGMLVKGGLRRSLFQRIGAVLYGGLYLLFAVVALDAALSFPFQIVKESGIIATILNLSAQIFIFLLGSFLFILGFRIARNGLKSQKVYRLKSNTRDA